MKPFRVIFPVLALLGLPIVSVAPRLAAEDLSGADLYEKCVKSTVFIVTPLKGGHSEGSGSLIDVEKRLVITNAHVVHDNDLVFVQFPVRNPDGSLMTDKKRYIDRIPAGQALKGKVLYRDMSRDLALVQLDKLPPDTPAIPLGKKSVRVGETVMNIGNPGKVASTFSTTRGEVRAVDIRDFVVGGSEGVMRIKARMVDTTNPVNPGDSGGPLIDKRGYQIAVTESGIFDGRTQNVNSFVDVTEVRAFLAEKKMTFKELSTEPDVVKAPDKAGPHVPKKDTLTTTPKKDPPAVAVVPPDKKAGPTDPPVESPPAATPADEKEAEQLLQRAKVFSTDEDKEFYAKKLKIVVDKYPTTAAAKEAKKLLAGLKK